MSGVQQQAIDILLSRHHISDPSQADFSVMNQADIVASASSVAGTLATFLTAVASISLVVGGVCIMNMMLSTVTDRTQEIGLRKAIGATRRDINVQFLAEACALTSIGGFLGVVIGYLVSFGLTYIGVIQTQVSLSSVLLALCVATFTGIVFGYYPASKASRLNPVDALRFE